MSELHKRRKTIGNKVELKEEQRRRLCSNSVNGRCSSLAKYPNTVKMPKDIALDYLANILVRIYLHLENNEHNSPQSNNKEGSNLL